MDDFLAFNALFLKLKQFRVEVRHPLGRPLGIPIALKEPTINHATANHHGTKSRLE